MNERVAEWSNAVRVPAFDSSNSESGKSQRGPHGIQPGVCCIELDRQYAVPLVWWLRNKAFSSTVASKLECVLGKARARDPVTVSLPLSAGQSATVLFSARALECAHNLLSSARSSSHPDTSTPHPHTQCSRAPGNSCTSHGRQSQLLRCYRNEERTGSISQRSCHNDWLPLCFPWLRGICTSLTNNCSCDDVVPVKSCHDVSGPGSRDVADSSSCNASNLILSTANTLCPSLTGPSQFSTGKRSSFGLTAESRCRWRSRQFRGKVWIVSLAPMSFVSVCDWRWYRRLVLLVLQMARTESLLAWMSTLGGAHSALGDCLPEHALYAESVSLDQLSLAVKVGDPCLVSRCWLFLALSYLQQGKVASARVIVRTHRWWLRYSTRLRDDIKLVALFTATRNKLKSVSRSSPSRK